VHAETYKTLCTLTFACDAYIRLHIYIIHSFIHTYNKLSLKFSVCVRADSFHPRSLERNRPVMALLALSARRVLPELSFAERERTSSRMSSRIEPAGSREVTRKKRIKLRVIRTKKDAIRTKITQPHGSEKIIALCAGEAARFRRADYRQTSSRSGVAPAPSPPTWGRRSAGGLGPKDSSAPVSSPVGTTGTATSSAPRHYRSRGRARTRQFSSAAVPCAAVLSIRTSLKARESAWMRSLFSQNSIRLTESMNCHQILLNNNIL